MDFRQLETFVQVAKLKSFSKAAEKLFITQPTVTNHIQNLEKELGTQLFDRMGKNISLTKSGALLYKNAISILNSFEMTKFELDEFKGHIHGHLELVSSSVPRKYLLPSIIHNFLIKYPDVTFSIMDNDSKEVINSILEGEYDFGIVGAKYDSNNLEYIKIMQDRLLLITPLGFRPDLANYSEITIAEIQNEKFIIRESGSGTREAVNKMLREDGLTFEDLKIVAHIEDMDTIKELVSLGTGLSFISEKAIKDDIKLSKFKVLNIKNLSVARDFYFVFHKNRNLSPLGERFKEFVLNH